MRPTPSGLMLCSVVAMLLAACQRPEAPTVAAPTPPAPLVQGPRIVTATWSFHTGDTCTATAGSAVLALDITASRDTLELVARVGHGMAMLPNRNVGIKFTGATGTWSITSHGTASHRLIASRPLTEDRAGEILILLEGGIVRIGDQPGLPELRIPNGGAPGREWFECVRRQLFP